MIGLDTNVLLRWILDGSMVEDDAPDQARLAAELMRNRAQAFYVNAVVLAEMVWVVRQGLKQSNEVVQSLIDRLLRSANVIVQHPQEVNSALAGLLQHGGDFTDHLVGALNRGAGCRTTVTFDRKAHRSPLFSPLATR